MPSITSTADILRDVFGVNLDDDAAINELHPAEQEAIRRTQREYNEPTEAEEDEFDEFRDLFIEDELPTSTSPSTCCPAPPDDLEYESFEDLWAYVLQWAFDHGFGIRIGTGAKYSPPGVRYRVYIECDKAQKKGITTSTVRDGHSRGESCPFRMCAQRQDGRNKVWSLRLMKHHNEHKPSLDPSTHACHRKLSPSDVQYIESQSLQGVPPKIIAEGLEKRGSKAKVSDVYNARYRLRTQKLQGLTPIQALFMVLEHDASGWIKRDTKDAHGRVTKLFFVHQKQIQLARTYSEVVFTDATYKTNRYGMPLIHFMGVAPVSKRRKNTTGSNMSTGFCFVNEENEETWTWAIEQFKDCVMYEDIDGFSPPSPKVWLRDGAKYIGEAINNVYPDAQQLLCLFHINQNVLAKINTTWRLHSDLTDEEAEKCRDDRRLALQRWWNVLSATSPTEYRNRLDYMYTEYSSYPKFISYLRDTQEPLHKMTVKYWTSQVQHFGNTSTSRLEGGHHTVKSFLHGSFGDLLDVITRIKLHIDREFRELKAALAMAIERVPASVNPSKVKVFDESLISGIMPLGLKLAARQYGYAISRDYNEECNGRWNSIFGMPCCHTMHRYLNSAIDEVIPKVFTTDFAARWTVERMRQVFQMPPPRDERDPAQAKRIGRPQGAPNRRQQGNRVVGNRGTDARDLSYVEHTENLPVPESHRRQTELTIAQQDQVDYRAWQAARQVERERLAAIARHEDEARHEEARHEDELHDVRVTTPEPTQDLGFQPVSNGPIPIDAQNHGLPPLPPPLPSNGPIDDATGHANDATEASRKRARAATVQSTSQPAPAALQSTSVATSKRPRGRPPLTAEQKARNAHEKKVKRLKDALAKLEEGPQP